MSYLEHLSKIDTIILDVDGVLTDSLLHVLEDGKLLRRMHTRDGYALKRAVQQDYRIIIITGGRSEGVIHRLKNLGISEIYSGIQDKLEVMDDLIEVYGLNVAKTAYMGDDMPDYESMRVVALPACPNNAAPEIKAISQYISPYNGGEGCVRDLLEKIMKVQGKWVATDVVNLTEDKSPFDDF